MPPGNYLQVIRRTLSLQNITIQEYNGAAAAVEDGTASGAECRLTIEEQLI